MEYHYWLDATLTYNLLDMQVAVAYHACMLLITQALAHWMGQDTPHTHSNRSILGRSTHLSRKKFQKKLGKSLSALLIAVICLTLLSCSALQVSSNSPLPANIHGYWQGDVCILCYMGADGNMHPYYTLTPSGPITSYDIWLHAYSEPYRPDYLIKPDHCPVGKVCIWTDIANVSPAALNALFKPASIFSAGYHS